MTLAERIRFLSNFGTSIGSEAKFPLEEKGSGISSGSKAKFLPEEGRLGDKH